MFNKVSVAFLFCAVVASNASGQVYKVGDKGLSNPRLIKRVDPEYSPDARQARIEGNVILEIEVTEQGQVENAKVVKSLDSGLDAEAIKAVGKWKFSPGKKDKKPVRVSAKIEVVFHLAPTPPKRRISISN